MLSSAQRKQLLNSKPTFPICMLGNYVTQKAQHYKSDINTAQARNAAVIKRQSPTFMSNDLGHLPANPR